MSATNEHEAVSLLTREEAAMRARITARTLDKFIASGRGPQVTRMGRRVLIQAEHLRSWIDGNTQPPRAA